MHFLSTLRNEKLYLWSIILVAISLPWPMIYANYSIGLLGLVWILSGNFYLKWKKLKINGHLFLFASSVFVLTVYGLLFTTNIKAGFFLLEKRLAIIVLPIIVLSSESLGKEKINKVAIIFVLSCFTAMTFCITRSFIKFMELYDYGYINHNFFTTDLITVLGISHVYFGLYLVISFVIITTMYFSKENKFATTMLYVLSSSYIFIFMILITAKMALISAILLFSLYVFKTDRRLLAIKHITILIFGLTLLAYLLMSINYNVLNRLNEMISISDFNINNNEQHYSSTRLGPWKCSVSLIKQYGLLGLGTGDVQESMNYWYQTHGLSNLIEFESHNQYMNIILSYGLLGLFFFTWCMLALFRLSISEHYTLYLLFLLAICLSCITENVFDLNKGIILFAFFNSLFLSSTIIIPK